MDEVNDEQSSERMKDPVIIDPNGDLLLRLRHPAMGTDYIYRVSTTALRQASHYFNVLLDASKFSEGITVDKRLRAIRGKHGEREAIPSAELPKIFVSDIGQVPEGVSTDSVVVLFLRILHNENASWPTPRLSFVALLAIVADRFAATTPIANYVIQRNWKTKLFVQKGPPLLTETRIRQQLLVGLILRFPDWVREFSAGLIVQGSEKWGEPCEDSKENEALWWNLPNNLEGKPKAMPLA